MQLDNEIGKQSESADVGTGFGDVTHPFIGTFLTHETAQGLNL